MKQVLLITFLSFFTSVLIGQVSTKDLGKFLKENPELQYSIDKLHIEKASNGEFNVYHKKYVFDGKTKVKTYTDKAHLLYILTPIMHNIGRSNIDVKYVFKGEFGTQIVGEEAEII